MTATSSDEVVIAAGRLPQRLALTTLGVADVALSRAFYKRLGLVASGLESDQVCFSEMQGTLFGLYRRLWEVAYKPVFKLDSAGRVQLPPPNSGT